MELCLPGSITGYDSVMLKHLLQKVLQAINWDLVLKSDRAALEEIEVNLEGNRSGSALRRLVRYLGTHLIEPSYGFDAEAMSRIEALSQFLLDGLGSAAVECSFPSLSEAVRQIA